MTRAGSRRVGPYEYETGETLGEGVSSVYLATDTRSPGGRVALKVIRNGPDAASKELALAEQKGAALQRQYLSQSPFVPQVYDIGSEGDCVYVAMEYVEGQDLSAKIAAGPIPVHTAVGIARQLCLFLEEIDSLDAGTADALPNTLLHNDLKPRNIRITPAGQIKVLDFGAAKTLTGDRGVTKNVYHTTEYTSPECLESGERDRRADAWALGAILYEMVAGRPAFSAASTKGLEGLIRSGRQPDVPAHCPRGLAAIIAKLLARHADDRYPGAEAIREDLDRFLAETETQAEQDGWPEKGNDEPPTRRSAPDADERPTRPAPGAGNDVATHPMVTAKAQPRLRRLVPAVVLIAGMVLIGAAAVNELRAFSQAQQAASTVPLQDFAGLTNVWTQYGALQKKSLFGFTTRVLQQAMERQTLVLAERVIADYRTPTPTVREAQWKAAEKALERALAGKPNDGVLRGTLRYTQGQLHRIDGEADRSRKQLQSAQRNFSDAVTAFREAASLRPNWPDPFLGLAHTLIYGMQDIDRGVEALAQAQRLGYAISAREVAQMADGYRMRGEVLSRAAASVAGLPQERDVVAQALAAFSSALEQYSKVPQLPGVPNHIRTTQRRVESLSQKLDALNASSPAPTEPRVADEDALKRGAALQQDGHQWA